MPVPNGKIFGISFMVLLSEHISEKPSRLATYNFYFLETA